MALVRDEGSRDLTRWDDPLAHDEESNPMGWRGTLWWGYAVVLLFFGAFGLWAAIAPLGSGAIAQGQVQVAGSQKTVQHLEGGIIREILIKEGQFVEQGQVLLVLDDTRARAEFERVDQQFMAALGREARLQAERAGLDMVSFPEELLARRDDPLVAAILEGEKRLFEGQRKAVESQVSLLERRAAKSQEEIAALLAQQTSDRRQLAIIEEEIVGVKELFDKGLERKPRLLALQRTQAQLQGSIDNREALMARAEQTIAETDFQRIGVLEEDRAEIERSLREVQTQIEDLRDQLSTARYALDRTAITAPQGGYVYGLRFHTPGGVVAPGDAILNIVPENEELIVRAQLDPNDIDVVQEGALASVRLTSFSQRTTKPVDGKVIGISADIISPEQGMPFYEARIELDPDMLAKQGITLTPGMPAMAIISTGDQTLLDYLISPISRSLETALREN